MGKRGARWVAWTGWIGMWSWIVIGACERGGGTPGEANQDDAVPPGQSEADQTEVDPADSAATIFSGRCASCHGTTGVGDGPVGRALDPPPANMTDPVWQAAITDEAIERIILEGGASVGRSPAMPANPDLRDRPEVVTALRQMVRDLAGEGTGP